MPTAHTSPLDEAYAHLFSEEHEASLRIAMTLLETGEDLDAVALVCEVLTAKGRSDLSGEALRRLVDARIRRGDMGGATVASLLAVDAGEDGKALRKSIAKAFARGSGRVSDGASPTPPPLPVAFALKPATKKLAGDKLLDRAEDVLRKWLASDDPVDEKAKVPKLPLASALAAGTLERLLEAATIFDARTGEAVIEQGTEGKAAFQVVRGMAEAIRESDGENVRLAALGPGALFGEMALVSDAPRAASVRAMDATRFLRFPRDTLEGLAKGDPNLGKELGRFCHARMVANLMRHSRILGSVAAEDRESLMARFETRTFGAGEKLTFQGEESESLFLIASGTVAVEGHDDDGDSIHIADLGPGDVVGEISLVLRRPATADVVAKHHTVALELSREEFQGAIREHPTLLSELYELATSREEETRSVVAQEALDVGDIVLL